MPPWRCETQPALAIAEVPWPARFQECPPARVQDSSEMSVDANPTCDRVDDRAALLIAARTAAAAALQVVGRCPRLAAALAAALVAPDRSTRVRAALSRIAPSCRALTLHFPVLRTHVAGLAYGPVEYLGYRGSSALDIVCQIATLLLEGADSLDGAVLPGEPQLDNLVRDILTAIPIGLDTWLQSHLDVELGALQRALGTWIVIPGDRINRPPGYAHVERLVAPYLREAGRASPAPQPPRFLVRKVKEAGRGRALVEVNGARSTRRQWITNAEVEMLRALARSGTSTGLRATKMRLVEHIPEIKPWIVNRPRCVEADEANGATYGVNAEMQAVLYAEDM